MNKYHLLLPAAIVALSGCYSNLHYQEQAVESARKYIFENARELTPEQYAFVKMTPPVFFTGRILNRNGSSVAEGSVASGGRLQVCIAWRIPEQKKDYLVFGVTDAAMNNWSPARLIRRPIAALDSQAFAALAAARRYALTSLNEQMSAAELNRIRFSYPELIRSKFDLGTPVVPEKNPAPAAKEEEEKSPRPWKKYPLPTVSDENVQLSLLWKLENDRYAVFCGVGKTDMSDWQISMAGIFGEDEVKKARLEIIKTPEKYLFPLETKSELQKEKTKNTAESSVSAKENSADNTVKKADSTAKGEK